MLIWAVIATAMALAAITAGCAYRLHIRKICEQLRFMSSHRTSMRLTEQLPFSELNELTDEINAVVDRSRKTAEETRQSEKQLKETIVNLSHDIRTPLTSVDGYLQLLSETDSEEEREHYLAVIRSRIGSLNQMLEELFTYTKLENENYEIVSSSMNFSGCVLDTVFSFYDEFQRRGIEPDIRFCDEQLMIRGNTEAISRALQNVIKNALEHGSEYIFMELCRKDDNLAVFRCGNRFSGADQIQVEKVFDRFYKADSSRNSTSTGLGLSIAKGLVEKTGGCITAKVEEQLFVIEIAFPLEEDER